MPLRASLLHISIRHFTARMQNAFHMKSDARRNNRVCVEKGLLSGAVSRSGPVARHVYLRIVDSCMYGWLYGTAVPSFSCLRGAVLFRFQYIQVSGTMAKRGKPLAYVLHF